MKMEDSSDFQQEEEKPVDPLTQLQRDLEGWREVLLPLNKLLNWDKPFYPAILVGLTTSFFLVIWYFEPSVLTTFSLLGLTISLVDFLVPIIGPTVLGRSGCYWWVSSVFCSLLFFDYIGYRTGVQEEQYKQICIRILNFRYHLADFVDTMVSLKNDRPKVYFLLVMGFLGLFAWIGSKIDNFFLTYLILNLFLLWPGMRRHSVMQKYINKIVTIFKRVVVGKQKAK